ncbi:unnamed protein product [Linum tenue]|uniref:Uncharacterized protein n=1 Tax=Linum tenue TaxID=586396 RepID=A0AAV0QU56_9ROSI|nr:unnamed protein product [Linum tenue]
MFRRRPKVLNAKLDKQRHLRMLGNHQETFLSFYTRQIWILCHLKFHLT